MVARRLTIVLTVAVALACGCEKTNHETIDKWLKTSKGVEKLNGALADPDLDPDLSAHAAANLVRRGRDPDVRARFEQLEPARRIAVIAKLAPRLWDLARVESDDHLPAGIQVTAKDALVTIRKWAPDAQRVQIDAYLIDWYAVKSYEGRAPAGVNSGASVMRLIGPPAAKKLMAVLNGVVAAPKQGQKLVRVHDELLLGLAATGDAEAVRYLLDLVKLDRGDPTLAQRAVDALFKAYVKPRGLIDLVPPDALVPNLDRIVALAKGDGVTNQIVDDAVALIRAVGPPRCLEILTGLIAAPHRSPSFKYVTAVNALACGGAAGLAAVVRALPETGGYDREELAGTVVLEITRLAPPAQVRATLRQLVEDRSTVVRWVAIEALAAMKSVEDAPVIARLAGSRDRLVGYWGVHNPERKPEPTLGQRARELGGQLGAER